MNDLYGRALVIHAGGDNYSDSPEPLGGGGARLACGVVPAAAPAVPPAALAALMALLLAAGGRALRGCGRVVPGSRRQNRA